MTPSYSSQFYANQSPDSYRAAQVMLPKVFALTHPASVVDVGCGVGTWLAAAGELGVERLVGYEGDWVQPHMLRDDAIELRRQDLERPIRPNEKFDLAMSLEVAEHLSPDRAESLVQELCALSDQVLFSAAVPGQGGVSHINEQWQDFWVELFKNNGYRHLDVLRPVFWQDRTLPIHYRQNAFLYLSEARLGELAARSPVVEELHPWPLNLVHPEMHLNNLNAAMAPPTLPQVLRTTAYLPVALVRSVMARLGRASSPR